MKDNPKGIKIWGQKTLELAKTKGDGIINYNNGNHQISFPKPPLWKRIFFKLKILKENKIVEVNYINTNKEI